MFSFGIVMEKERHRNTVDDMCRSSISRAYEAFLNFEESGAEGSYWFGVGAFYTFKELYLESGFYDATTITAVSSAYAKLLYHKSLNEKELALLLTALKALTEDCTSIVGYDNLQKFVDA